MKKKSKMADQDETIRQFANVTGVDQNRARFHLESSAWNLEVALANFYEEGGEHDVDEGTAADPLDADEFEEMEDDPQPLNIPSSRKENAPKPKKNSRFGTIGSLRADDDSSSEDEGQAFYAGGSERSGQQVLGPSKKKKPEGFVQDIFQSAREHGAEQLEDEWAATSGSDRAGAFAGTGYRLGETEGPLESVAGPSLRPPKPHLKMKLKMWQNGFSIDDGELRAYDDPRNKEFLESIRQGSVPLELVRSPEARGKEIHLDMEDHRQEDFVKPKATVKAFSGEGHMLGSQAERAVGLGDGATETITVKEVLPYHSEEMCHIFTGEGHMLGSPAPAIVATASSGASSVPRGAAPEVKVDSSKPVTNIQIRLADGKRMVSKFNLTNTVGDIRNHIVASNPQYAATNFVLQTTFPNKELTNESQTLEEAKLANAVIVQRLK